MSNTRLRTFNEEYGSWNIIWISRFTPSFFPLPLNFSPWKKISPSVMSFRPITAFPVVVLPEPDSPTRPYVVPLGIERLTPSTALTWSFPALKQPPLVGKGVFHFLISKKSLLIAHRRPLLSIHLSGFDISFHLPVIH